MSQIDGNAMVRELGARIADLAIENASLSVQVAALQQQLEQVASAQVSPVEIEPTPKEST